jgi:subtilisin family serine protease
MATYLRRCTIAGAFVALVVSTLAVVPATAAGDGPTPADPTSGSAVLAVEVDPSAAASQRAILASTATEVARLTGGAVRNANDPSVVSVEVPAPSATAVQSALASADAARHVTRSALFTLSRTPNDPQYLRQGYLGDIALSAAWGRTRGSSATTVAVVDSGLATGHPDIAGKVAGRFNAVDGGRDVRDRVGHGTAVASVAAAATDNDRGIAGVGWRTSILAVKVADDRGAIWGDAVARGIRWATKQGADVINLSLGSPTDDPAVRRAVAFAVDRDVVVAAAVSNSGSTDVPYPAAYPRVIAVGATDGDSLADFSDRGAEVDVAAPGAGIRAAVPGGYAWVDGTSFATAIVSGQAALMRSVRPGMPARRIVGFIDVTARLVGSGDAAVDRVHAYDAVRRVEGTPDRPRDVRATARSRSVVVRWQPPSYEGRAPVSAYRVDVRRVGGSWERAGRVDDANRRYVVRGLLPDRRYDVRVSAVNRFGAGLPGTPVRVRTTR